MWHETFDAVGASEYKNNSLPVKISVQPVKVFLFGKSPLEVELNQMCMRLFVLCRKDPT